MLFLLTVCIILNCEFVLTSINEESEKPLQIDKKRTKVKSLMRQPESSREYSNTSLENNATSSNSRSKREQYVLDLLNATGLNLEKAMSLLYNPTMDRHLMNKEDDMIVYKCGTNLGLDAQMKNLELLKQAHVTNYAHCMASCPKIFQAQNEIWNTLERIKHHLSATKEVLIMGMSKISENEFTDVFENNMESVRSSFNLKKTIENTLR